MSVKGLRVSVPLGMDAALEGLARAVLREQPSDIYMFAADHFESLLHKRQAAENLIEKLLNKGVPRRRFLRLEQGEVVLCETAAIWGKGKIYVLSFKNFLRNKIESYSLSTTGKYQLSGTTPKFVPSYVLGLDGFVESTLQIACPYRAISDIQALEIRFCEQYGGFTRSQLMTHWSVKTH
ncbi:hypothetical protein J6590_015969 [Homalodisca vitripennis]|nr:hypothetical protein J6590_015969 [Homalodisca vitripennis]